jgi:hypothetical protein
MGGRPETETDGSTGTTSDREVDGLAPDGIPADLPSTRAADTNPVLIEGNVEAGADLAEAPIGQDDAAGTDAGFAWDFSVRANAALASTPAWTCAATLPTVPVADSTAARDVIQSFVARVTGVAVSDVSVTEGPCNTPTTTSCSERFAHDCAKSGGDTYNIVLPLAEELEAQAGSVEETIWVPASMTGNVVLSGIVDGLLVGMVVFNGELSCR